MSRQGQRLVLHERGCDRSFQRMQYEEHKRLCVFLEPEKWNRVDDELIRCFSLPFRNSLTRTVPPLFVHVRHFKGRESKRERRKVGSRGETKQHGGGGQEEEEEEQREQLKRSSSAKKKRNKRQKCQKLKSEVSNVMQGSHSGCWAKLHIGRNNRNSQRTFLSYLHFQCRPPRHWPDVWPSLWRLDGGTKIQKRREALAFKCAFIIPLWELQCNTVYMTKKKTVK